MLAGVQHQQEALAGERLRHTLRRNFTTAKLQPDSGSHRGGDQPGIGEGRELGQPHAVSKMRPQLARKCESQCCLPNAAGTGQRDEPIPGDKVQDLAELLSRPISSETGFGVLVGGRTDACAAVASPAPAFSGLADRMRISPVN